MTIKHPAMKAHGVDKTLEIFDKRLRKGRIANVMI
jgi:hypothetical protein